MSGLKLYQCIRQRFGELSGPWTLQQYSQWNMHVWGERESPSLGSRPCDSCLGGSWILGTTHRGGGGDLFTFWMHCCRV